MGEFQGVVPALITPFDSKGKIDEDALCQLIERNIEANVDGFWITGGTGESVLLTDDEIIRVAQLSGLQCRGRVKTIVHVGALTTRSAVKMATAVGKANIDAISCVPPFFYRPNIEGIINHYKAISDAASLPFFVYNQPKYTGVEISPNLMKTLIDHVPLVAGVKHSAPDFHNIRRFSQLGIDVFTGSGSLFIPALVSGASGVVDGPLTVAPELWVSAYEAFKKGDIERALVLQEKGAKLVDLAGKFGMQATCKALVNARLHINAGSPRLPIASLTDEETKQLLREAQDMGLIRPDTILSPGS
ncbi:dihydrodipicolinate synthase family protein [SAR202 cluster bacterium AD-804-J14_MRT_500m]|nr:dihydrodipicolinate synthase family protein [SAR202 cluster bacterium AD-804-J14_MRT_500m]